MESTVDEIKTNVPARYLEKLRAEFRNWYGSLSVEELTLNKALVEEIEKFERLFGYGLVAE